MTLSLWKGEAPTLTAGDANDSIPAADANDSISGGGA